MKIEIYSSRICPFCHLAKKLLDAKGVSYEEFFVDDDPVLADESIRRSNGRRTVPQIFIESDHIGGYDDLAALVRQGGLDAILQVSDTSGISL
jgi:glutaredoxin 3